MKHTRKRKEQVLKGETQETKRKRKGKTTRTEEHTAQLTVFPCASDTLRLIVSQIIAGKEVNSWTFSTQWTQKEKRFTLAGTKDRKSDDGEC